MHVPVPPRGQSTYMTHSVCVDLVDDARKQFLMPFLPFCHALTCRWVPWASVFQTPCTITFHPFVLFREVDCYDFPSPDSSSPPVSVDLKRSTWVMSPVTAVHEQARASRLSAISWPGRGAFALKVF